MAQGYTGASTFNTARVKALIDGATVATDVSLGSVFTLTTTQIFTLSNPTNSFDGAKIVWRIKQGGAGSFTITLGADFRVASDINAGVITLSTAVGTIDYLGAIYNADDSKWDIISFTKGITT